MTDTIHISDSIIYGRSWCTPALVRLFSEKERIHGWIEVMAVLAETQSEFGLVPAEAAQDIRNAYESINVDQVFGAVGPPSSAKQTGTEGLKFQAR